MGVNKKGGLVGGFDQLRAPDAPTISVEKDTTSSITVTITNPTDTGGGDITGYAVSALTGPIEDTTFAVTVVSDSGNKYAIDGTTQGTVTLHKGHTYIFDQSDSSNSGHPLRLSTTSNGSHGGGSEYTTGVTTSGTPGSAGAFTKIAIATDAPSTLYYYCTNHSGMGGTANLKASLQGGASGSSSPITVSSLTDAEAYNVRASAINVFGQSPYSDATSITVGNPDITQQIGLFFGGSAGAGGQNYIDQRNLASTGNASDFGDMSAGKYNASALGNTTRGIVGGGTTLTNVIEYVTFASASNTTDFGDLSASKQTCAPGANHTRGIFAGGETSGAINVIEYITIASTGDATDFGDLLSVVSYAAGSLCSPTRSVIAGGFNGAAFLDVIQYVTTASTGNSTDFGDLSQGFYNGSGVSSSTRGIVGAGILVVHQIFWNI